MALHTQKRRKREEQRAEETELTGNICSLCLPPSGRVFTPPCRLVRTDVSVFSSRSRMHWGLSAWPVSRGVQRGREREWNLQLCSSMRKNYFSGNTKHSRTLLVR